jgi:hypothetical protein
VLQECHAVLGMYQGELLQEVAYILRSQHASSPAAARTRQAAMDALRLFGPGGVDAYRQARAAVGAPGGPVMGMPAGGAGVPAQRDPGGWWWLTCGGLLLVSISGEPALTLLPRRCLCAPPCPSAAVAAERQSLLDEVKRLVEQAGASTEILNELILNKTVRACCRAGVFAWARPFARLLASVRSSLSLSLSRARCIHHPCLLSCRYPHNSLVAVPLLLLLRAVVTSLLRCARSCWQTCAR